MLESVDKTDLKSVEGDLVGVQVPLPAPIISKNPLFIFVFPLSSEKRGELGIRTLKLLKYAGVAQLVEHLPSKQRVGESCSLVRSTCRIRISANIKASQALEVGSTPISCSKRFSPITLYLFSTSLCHNSILPFRKGLQEIAGFFYFFTINIQIFVFSCKKHVCIMLNLLTKDE